MGLVGATGVMGLVMAYRYAWFMGRYGSGKTALAMYMAYNLKMAGHVKYLVTNIRCVWADDPWTIELDEHGKLNTVIVMDEAGMFWQTSKESDAFITFARKMNVVLLMPSHDEVPNKMRKLRIHQLANMHAFGIPAWWYVAKLHYADIRDRYMFGWWQPKNVLGVYDTRDKPTDDDGIGEWISVRAKQAIAASGRQREDGKHGNRASEHEFGGGEVAGDGWSDIRAASETFEGVGEKIENALSVLGRRRRR